MSMPLPDSYMLDTNILSELVRTPQGRIAHTIARIGEDRICTSIIVASELRFGAEKAQSRRLQEQVQAILDVLQIRELTPPVDHHYARIRTHLEQIGTPIGPNDLLIAAHALAGDCIVVTANVREFQRVPGLGVQNWLNP